MYIKSLTIYSNDKEIRKLEFKLGLNLILNEGDQKKENKTGNNVGKTTVLKLINYCLGGNEKEIYKSSESDSKENKKIKEFLTNKNVNLKLILYKNLDNPNDEIVIERNFSNKYIVNGNNVKNKNKLEELSQELLPDFIKDKMSIRSIIHYYIRYTNISTQNTLKILEKFSDNQYEPIFLTFLGISPENLKDKKTNWQENKRK